MLGTLSIIPVGSSPMITIASQVVVRRFASILAPSRSKQSPTQNPLPLEVMPDALRFILQPRALPKVDSVTETESDSQKGMLQQVDDLLECSSQILSRIQETAQKNQDERENLIISLHKVAEESESNKTQIKELTKRLERYETNHKPRFPRIKMAEKK
ncbi:hypothetical protein K7432_004587 [Basidiobolus ranarum]|uniref:Uncharacterized protein n=1 Tax=Basidiobolus ranarum TaxID=34480 RepID=A0ABR2W4F6_9FUNG